MGWDGLGELKLKLTQPQVELEALAEVGNKLLIYMYSRIHSKLVTISYCCIIRTSAACKVSEVSLV